MQNPYIIVQSRHPVTLQSEVNRFAKEGYDPVGGITRHCWGDDNDTMVWFQAMYRAPEPDIDRRDLSNWDGERPVPECGTEGVLRTGDLNPVPIAGDEPLPMTWEQECRRLEKAYSDLQAMYEDEQIWLKRALKDRDEARAECERLRESAGMDKPDWALDQSDVEDLRETLGKVSAACEGIMESGPVTPSPQYLITVHRPDSPRCEFHADFWEVDSDIHSLTIWRHDQEGPIAEFPAHEWRFVEAEPVEPTNDDMEDRRDEIAVTLEPGQVVKINGMPFRVATENAMAIGTRGNAKIAGLVDPDQHDIGRKGP